MKYLYFVFILIITISYTPLAFSGIRCDRDLISDGDTTLEVTVKIQKCGEIIGKEVIRSENSVGGIGDGHRGRPLLYSFYFLRILHPLYFLGLGKESAFDHVVDGSRENNSIFQHSPQGVVWHPSYRSNNVWLRASFSGVKTAF